MPLSEAAERHLKDGDPQAALARLQEDVRARPSDPKLRVFLFQLLCVLGQWDRALNQLEVATGLDPGALAMAQVYGDAVRCEPMREAVFAGTTSPMILGEPDQWLALLIESSLVAGRGGHAQVEELRQRAFEAAPMSTGTLDDTPFAWIADADSRLGPVLEAIINGRYYWVPFARLRGVTFEKPEDLRDLVWLPAHLELENGGDVLALIPTRYASSQTSGDGAIVLARKTIWEAIGEDAYRGLGQRLLATDGGEAALLDIRSLSIDRATDDTAATAHA